MLTPKIIKQWVKGERLNVGFVKSILPYSYAKTASSDKILFATFHYINVEHELQPPKNENIQPYLQVPLSTIRST